MHETGPTTYNHLSKRAAPGGLALHEESAARFQARAGSPRTAGGKRGAEELLYTSDFEFPRVSHTTLLWVAAGFVALFMVAVLLEMLRKRAERSRRLRAEWSHVDRILQERGFTNEEQALVRRMIERHCPNAPLNAVTNRRQFDHCVDGEMSRHRQEGASHGDLEKFGTDLRDIRKQLALDFVPQGQQIHSTRELVGGQAMWVAPASHGKHDGWSRIGVTEVNEAYFHTSLPKDQAGAPGITPGSRIQCRLWRDDDARYLFETVMIAQRDDPPAWVMEHTPNLTRIQSRQHYRVQYNQNTWAGILDPPPGGDPKHLPKQRPVTRLRGRIANISAGGVALAADMTPPANAYLRIDLEFPGHPPMRADARIVHTASLSGGRCLVRAAFVGLSEETQDRIARFVTQRQQILLHPEDERKHA